MEASDNYQFRELKLQREHTFVFFFIVLVNLTQAALEVHFTLLTRNWVFFFACIGFGPFQMIAAILIICISKFDSISKLKNLKMNFSSIHSSHIDFVSGEEARNLLARLASRLVAISFITYVNSLALNLLYIVNCAKYESLRTATRATLQIDENDERNYCANVHINMLILILNTSTTILNLIFCVPYNMNWH